jgi:phage gp36-like protein
MRPTQSKVHIITYVSVLYLTSHWPLALRAVNLKLTQKSTFDMAFIDKSDIESALTSEEITEITRSDDTLVDSAILSALGEMRSYLATKYDVDTIYQATGSNRDGHLVRIAVTLAVYYLFERTRPGVESDTRIERYNNAISYLKRLVHEDVNPNLPVATGSDNDYIQSASNTKRNNYF